MPVVGVDARAAAGGYPMPVPDGFHRRLSEMRRVNGNGAMTTLLQWPQLLPTDTPVGGTALSEMSRQKAAAMAAEAAFEIPLYTGSKQSDFEPPLNVVEPVPEMSITKEEIVSPDLEPPPPDATSETDVGLQRRSMRGLTRTQRSTVVEDALDMFRSRVEQLNSEGRSPTPSDYTSVRRSLYEALGSAKTHAAAAVSYRGRVHTPLGLDSGLVLKPEFTTTQANIGNGVVATQAIMRGAIVTQYVGWMLPRDVTDTLRKATVHLDGRDRLLLPRYESHIRTLITNNTDLDGAVDLIRPIEPGSGVGSLINHFEDTYAAPGGRTPTTKPNVDYVTIFEGVVDAAGEPLDPQVFAIAIRDIVEGEYLHSNYGRGYSAYDAPLESTVLRSFRSPVTPGIVVNRTDTDGDAFTPLGKFRSRKPSTPLSPTVVDLS